MSPTPTPDRAEATVLSLPADRPMELGPDAPLAHIMASMRAMRRLKPDPVPNHLIEELVRAATWGPSASNAQHYAFVVVTDRAKMAELGALWRNVASSYESLGGVLFPALDDPAHQRMAEALAYQAEHFDDTPVLIAACHQRLPMERTLADPRTVRAVGQGMGWGNFAKFIAGSRVALNITEASSIYPAVQNLLLMARAHGLAATLTAWHLFQAADFAAALEVPKTHGIYALIPVGWPVGNFGPVRRRPLADVLHWNTFGGGL